jgi:hypothetical protein
MGFFRIWRNVARESFFQMAISAKVIAIPKGKVSGFLNVIQIVPSYMHYTSIPTQHVPSASGGAAF